MPVGLSLLYSLVVILLTPSLVTWGAPKVSWQPILIFLYSFPIDFDVRSGDYVLDCILLADLFW